MAPLSTSSFLSTLPGVYRNSTLFISLGGNYQRMLSVTLYLCSTWPTMLVYIINMEYFNMEYFPAIYLRQF
jgi:hypothetical protein